MINKIKIKPCASLPGQGVKMSNVSQNAASMELGDLGFLCDRKPCSKSIFKLFEQLFDTRYLFFAYRSC